MVMDLTGQYKPQGVPVRMVFFGDPAGNAEYEEQFAVIREIVSARFGAHMPSVSYVAQPSCRGGMLLEIQEVELRQGDVISYKQRKAITYVIIEREDAKRLYLSGVTADSLCEPIYKQSEAVFAIIDEILLSEQIPVYSITRQWNYIEQITAVKEGKQNYQEFNNARSVYYDKVDWTNGYPAATGIGTLFGGIMVDLNAEKGDNWQITAIDNPLQIPAHVYSEKVLISSRNAEAKKKTTPKFERAKAVETTEGKLIYISGTAAIRGENSLKNMEIQEHTRTTLENIEYLISAKNRANYGVYPTAEAALLHFRIYLKYMEHYTVVRQIIEAHYPDLPVGYVLADVCRPELLIEIEGLATC